MPAFLFYPQRWLEGSAEFSPAEKGIYIDLLAYQHQKGNIPTDIKRLARLVGLPQDEFDTLWEAVKGKFVVIDGNRMVNRTLDRIISENATKSATNQLTGNFATLIRQNPQISAEFKNTLKSEFNVSDYDLSDIKNETKRLTKWFYGRLESIININRDYKEDIGGTGEKGTFCQKPLPEHFNGLPDIRIGGIKELVAITKKINLTDDEVKGMWNVFKVQNLDGIKYYQDEGAVYSHFTNWMKTQNFKDNGQQPGSSASRAKSNAKSAGAYQLLEQLKKENGHN